MSRYEYIRAESGRQAISKMCRWLGVSRSGYYDWAAREQSARTRRNAELREMIRQVFEEHGGRYGSPRIHAELLARGQSVGRRRVERLMRLDNLQGFQRKRFRYLEGDRGVEPAHNVLSRRFTVGAPNKVWTGDITYIWTSQGWLYLAVIIDLFSRKVVGWSMSNQPDRHLALEALKMAVEMRQPKPGLIHHTDRGMQYTSRDYRAELDRHGFRLQHEPYRKLLGQRRVGELLRHPGARATGPT